MSLSLRKWGTLVILSIIWGSSYILIKKGLTGLTPIQLGSLRVIVTTLIIAPIGYKKIKMIPIRPGEKVAEKLIGLSESLRAREGFGHYILSPAHYDIASESSHFEYTSADDVLSSVALEQYLDNDLNIIEQPMESFIGKNIEEIR